MTPKHDKEQDDKWDFIKMCNFRFLYSCFMSLRKWKDKNWEKIFVNYTFDKRSMYKLKKKILQLNIRQLNTIKIILLIPIGFSTKTHEWLMSTWNEAQNH